MKAIELLRAQFGDVVRLEEKRPGIQQVYAPLYHEDGDMIEVFLDLPKDASLSEGQPVRLSDHGMTLMRLSYSFELDTLDKEKMLQEMLRENGVVEEDGELSMESGAESLYPAIMQFSKTIAKVCSMRPLSRETLAAGDENPRG